MRTDLLALTPDDLSVLTNRGTVKRAQKELEANDPTSQIADDPAGDLVVTWSDGTVCRFPHGKSIQDAACSSGALGITRHIVRSVLAYQQFAKDAAPAPSPAVPTELPQGETEQPSPSEAATSTPSAPENVLTEPNVSVADTPPAVWDPGAIADEALAAHFPRTSLTQARKRFAEGVLVELTRGAKPVARFLDENCTIRFLVPGDIRYVTGDCAESALAVWGPVAVWAFRELPADQLVGLVCLRQSVPPAPREPLDQVRALLDEICHDGVGNVSPTWPQRLARQEPALRQAGLTWLADLVEDIGHQHAMYAGHDARFEPPRLVHYLGELTARTRAVLQPDGPVPQPLVRGSRSDRTTEIAGGRLMGVGLGVRPGPKHTTVRAYLLDVDSGTLMAVERTFADPPPEEKAEPRSFSDLGDTVLVRGVSLTALGSSQLLIKAGKRTPGGTLVLPRTASSLTLHPQRFQWELLQPPFAAEGFSQLAARFKTLPPACLRARRCTENLHVIPVRGAEEVTFDGAHQRLYARLVDAAGNAADLVHPYHHRGRAGFDDLSAALGRRGEQLRFVCGHVRTAGRSLEIHPIALVFEDGGHRFCVQPWVANKLPTLETTEASAEGVDTAESAASPLEDFWRRLEDRLADLLVTGVAGCHARDWQDLATVGRQLGFTRLTLPIARLADSLDRRTQTLRWDPTDAVAAARELCLLSRLAAD